MGVTLQWYNEINNKKEDIKRAGKPSQARFLSGPDLSQPSITDQQFTLIPCYIKRPAKIKTLAPSTSRLRPLLRFPTAPSSPHSDPPTAPVVLLSPFSTPFFPRFSCPSALRTLRRGAPGCGRAELAGPRLADLRRMRPPSPRRICRRHHPI